MRKPRKWQQIALESQAFCELKDGTRQNMLVVVTPGGGKTFFALLAALVLEKARIIVVVPTVNLRSQWAQDAREVGLRISCFFENCDGCLSPDYHGVVVTYAQVASNPELFHHLTESQKTLVILDEIHHAGDTLSWGANIQQAFEAADCRILLSGTPFRTDSIPIPYVRYENGVGQADFSYGYAEAIRDQVCRRVRFGVVSGDATWNYNGERVQASFSDRIKSSQSRRRLKAALTTHGFSSTLLANAHQKLVELRGATTNAGALALAINQRHAEQIASQLESITGIQPAVVISDIPESSDIIKSFKASSDPWIVAVKMVSEGIDIPRLAVLAYASTTSTELFFRQAVGRIARGRTLGYAYIPDDPAIRKFATDIEEELFHSLILNTTGESASEESSTPLTGIFEALNSSGYLRCILSGESQIPVDERDEIQHYRKLYSAKVERLSKFVSGLNPGSRIHSALNKRQCVYSVSQCTLAQLVQRVEWLDMELDLRLSKTHL